MDELVEETKTQGRVVVRGAGEGKVVSTSVPLSFWGGLNPSNGKIIDKYHHLNGSQVCGKIFILPEGRGSCTGSVVLLEAILSGNAPNGIILRETDEIITLGGIVANEIFSKPIPIIIVNDVDFEIALQASFAKIDNDCVSFIN